VSETVEPEIGEVMETVGGTVSIGTGVGLGVGVGDVDSILVVNEIIPLVPKFPAASFDLM
jgi:hypothetical protein